MTHLIDDKTVAKMGHPVVVIRSDVGHQSLDLGHPPSTHFVVVPLLDVNRSFKFPDASAF
jgi:hypothetical protein